MSDDVQSKAELFSKQIESWYSYWQDNIQRARINTKYIYCSQWGDSQMQTREQSDLATLTFNLLPSISSNVIGKQRKNTPEFKVEQVDASVSQEVTDVVAGKLRDISVKSNFNQVYQEVYRDAYEAGWGAFIMRTDYKDEDSMDQEFIFDKVYDPFSVYFDPNAMSLTKDDGEFAGYLYSMPKKKFKKKYPSIDLDSINFRDGYYGRIGGYGPENQNIGPAFAWASDQSVTICMHYVKEFHKLTLYLLEDNTSITKEKYDEQYADLVIKPEIVRKRDSVKSKIKFYRLIQDRIIEEGEFPGYTLPVFYADGNSKCVDGQQYTRSFAEDVKDAQHLVNYTGSEIVNQILNAKKPNFMADAEVVKGHECWKEPLRYHGTLTYNGYAGQAPTYIAPIPFSPELLTLFEQQQRQVREIVGVFDESRGQQSNASSGLAIMARQEAANDTQELIGSNVNRAMEALGDAYVKAFPKVYDGSRTISILSKSGEPEFVHINNADSGSFVEYEGGVQASSQSSMEIPEKLSGLQVIAGPNFATQKQRAVQQLVDFGQAMNNPEAMSFVAGEAAQNLDIENAKLISDRFKTLLPFNIYQAEKQGISPQPTPPGPSPQEQKMQADQQYNQQKLMLEQQKLVLEKEKIENEHTEQVGKLIGTLSQVQARLQAAEAEMLKSENENNIEQVKLALDVVKNLTSSTIPIIKNELGQLSQNE